MANTNKSPKSGGSSGDTLGAIAIAGAVIGLAKPVVDLIGEKRKERLEERKDWVTIPELCSKGAPMKLDCAVDALEKLNLKVVYSAIEIKNAHIKYKDCFDKQIVRVNCRQKKKVAPGTLVILTYVTSEIIEESQRLFDESENNKIKLALEKSEKRSEQKEKRKNLTDSISSTIKQKTIAAVSKVKKSKDSGSITIVSEEENI